MTLFDRFKHGVDVTKFKADQLMRINRIQGDIGSIKQDISRIYSKIAVTAIELHKNSTLTNPELVDLCTLIDQLNKDILEKESMIAAIRQEENPQFVLSANQYNPINPCPKCNFDVPMDAEYCPNCGNRMSVVVNPTNLDSTYSGVVCSKCGTKTQNGSEFCPQCGQPLNPKSRLLI